MIYLLEKIGGKVNY